MGILKTHRGAAKRFIKRKSGSLKCRRSYRAHLLTCKSSKKKRQARGHLTLQAADAKRAHALLTGY